MSDVIDLIAALNRTSQQGSARAAIDLGNIQDASAIEPLADALTDDDPRVALQVAVALAKFGDGRSLDTLLHTLTLEPYDSDWSSLAVDGILLLHDNRAVPLLLAMLNHPQWGTRYFVIDALGKMGDISAVDALITALYAQPTETDFDLAIQQKLLEALVRLGDKRALPVFLYIQQNAKPRTYNDVAAFVKDAITRILGFRSD